MYHFTILKACVNKQPDRADNKRDFTIEKSGSNADAIEQNSDFFDAEMFLKYQVKRKSDQDEQKYNPLHQ